MERSTIIRRNRTLRAICSDPTDLKISGRMHVTATNPKSRVVR
jgi:hypothetical protein